MTSDSNRKSDDGSLFSGSCKQRAEDHGNSFAVDRYIGEKDRWKKFTATGENSDRITSVGRKSKKWDDKLEKIPPKKT